MYADLCVRLEKDPRIAPAVEAQQNGFKRLLLNQCQTAFEQLLEPQAEGSGDEYEEARALRKHRALGNVKFVGQLLVRGMLSSKLLIALSEELLKNREVCADALESLAALLTVACPKFDTPEWCEFPQLATVLDRVSELAGSRSVPARIRFLFRDLLDLRKAGWPSRTSSGAPMKLDDVRESRATDDRGGHLPECSPTTPMVAAAPPPVARTNEGGAAAESPARKAVWKPSWKVEAPSLAWSPKAPVPAPHTPSTTTPTSSAPASPALKHTAPAALKSPALDPKVAGLCPAAETPKPFDPREFRRVLSSALKDLGVDRNVAVAVRKIRAQNVPKAHQAKEFADLLTRAAEENRGPVRRSAFAFAAGLAAATESAFDRKECMAGVEIFFRDIYEDLLEEVPRLAVITSAELMPTICSVLPEEQLKALLPKDVLMQM